MRWGQLANFRESSAGHLSIAGHEQLIVGRRCAKSSVDPCRTADISRKNSFFAKYGFHTEYPIEHLLPHNDEENPESAFHTLVVVRNTRLLHEDR